MNPSVWEMDAFNPTSLTHIRHNRSDFLDATGFLPSGLMPRRNEGLNPLQEARLTVYHNPEVGSTDRPAPNPDKPKRYQFALHRTV
jgi:hypothetical protein